MCVCLAGSESGVGCMLTFCRFLLNYVSFNTVLLILDKHFRLGYFCMYSLMTIKFNLIGFELYRGVFGHR